MTDTPKTKAPIEVRHSAAAEEWALSADRAVVFTVLKTEPNPDLGKPLDPQPERETHEFAEAAVIALDERETIEVRVDYTMPSKPNAGLALAYLKRARQSADLAMSWLIETAIGEEGYDALTDELSGLEPNEAMATLQDVTAQIQRVAMGGLEPPKASASK